jgi:hypothetical protein
LNKIGGEGLLKYNDTLYTLLSRVYPEFEWLPWKFGNCPPSFWKDLKNQRNFMEWVGKQLNVNEMEDWYKVTHKVSKIKKIFKLKK